MGITASSYTLFPDTISCSGEVEGILSLSAGPDIVSNPADIVMVPVSYTHLTLPTIA